MISWIPVALIILIFYIIFTNKNKELDYTIFYNKKLKENKSNESSSSKNKYCLKEGLVSNQIKPKDVIAKNGLSEIIEASYQEKHLVFKKIRVEMRENGNNEKKIENELNILSEIFDLSTVPRCFPHFLGFEKHFDKANTTLFYFFYFEFYPSTLKKKIENIKILSFKNIESYFYDLVRGLAFLQNLGISHGDLKPENLMISEKGHIIIIDFGSAQKMDYIKLYDFRGTPAYRSPEWLQKDQDAKLLGSELFKSDVFSLGLVVLEMAKIYQPDESDDLNKIKEWIEKFENKFKKEKLANKESFQNFLTLLSETLRFDQTQRPDFVHLFEKFYMNQLSNFVQLFMNPVSQNEELKYCILIEDMDYCPPSSTDKFQRFEKDQEILLQKKQKKEKEKKNQRERQFILITLLIFILSGLSFALKLVFWIKFDDKIFYEDNYQLVFRSFWGIIIIDPILIVAAVVCFLMKILDSQDLGECVKIFVILCSVVRIVLGIQFLAGNDNFLKKTFIDSSSDFHQNHEIYNLLYWNFIYEIIYLIIYGISFVLILNTIFMKDEYGHSDFKMLISFSLSALLFLISISFNANLLSELGNKHVYFENYPMVFRSYMGSLVLDVIILAFLISVLFFYLKRHEFEDLYYKLCFTLGIYSFIRIVLAFSFVVGDDNFCKNIIDSLKVNNPDLSMAFFMSWVYEIIMLVLTSIVSCMAIFGVIYEGYKKFFRDC